MLRAIRSGIIPDSRADETVAKYPENPGDDSVREVAWLFRVARNLWLDKIKSAAVSKRTDSDLSNLFMEMELDSLELEDEVHVAMNSMLQLPETHRQVLYLRAIEELNIDEIANTLGMTRGAVKTNLSLARKQMRLKAEKRKVH